MTMYLNYDIEMLRNLSALYKYTDRFLTIFLIWWMPAAGLIEKDLEICRILTG